MVRSGDDGRLNVAEEDIHGSIIQTNCWVVRTETARIRTADRYHGARHRRVERCSTPHTDVDPIVKTWGLWWTSAPRFDWLETVTCATERLCHGVVTMPPS